MPLSDISASSQDYLKVVWSLAEWSEKPVTVKLIAERLNVKHPSASDAIKKLTAQGYLEHAPYSSITLTDRGRKLAVEMIRRHRLIETFLVETLGYGWDQVHDEAERLEHAVSDFMVNKLDELLGHPTRDPHGDPIPNAAGEVTIPDAVALSETPHSTVAVERISDSDPALLQFFDKHGITVGSVLHLSPGEKFSDTFAVRLANSDSEIALGQSAAAALFVSEAPQS